MLLIEDIHYVDVKDPVFKYRLLMDIANQVDFLGLKLKEDIHNDYCSLFTDGLIIGRKLYAYDGASGPTKDTKDTMHGALDHDIFWQLIEEGFLGEEWREVSNAHLKKQCSSLERPDPSRSPLSFTVSTIGTVNMLMWYLHSGHWPPLAALPSVFFLGTLTWM